MRGNFPLSTYNAVMRAVITPEIAANLHLVGDRWTLLILRDLFLGRTRFEALLIHTGAGRATLTRRLNGLLEAGLIQRLPYGGGRYEYQLAAKGQGLFPAAMCAWHWEQQFAPTPRGILPGSLIHEDCGTSLVPKVVCAACGGELHRQEVRLDAGSTFQDQVKNLAVNGQRRRRVAATGQDDNFTQFADLVGDRWSILILAAMFFGVTKYDEFQQLLGIATNILGDRLSRLTEAKVVLKTPYQQNPPRYRYLLSPRGEALYGFVMTVWQWAKTWTEDGEAANTLTHRCGSPLVVDVNCGHCQNSLKLNSFTLN